MVGTGTTSSEAEKEEDEEAVVNRTTHIKTEKATFLNNPAERFWQNEEVSLKELYYRHLTIYILTSHF